MTATTDRVLDYWDRDAAIYDRAASHHPRNPAELAAWRATLRALLPAPPATVLDVGAGTGFVSLLLADIGYRVTSLDLSPQMLVRLRAKAEQGDHELGVVEGDAERPPAGQFDVVVERHLVWTLPRPDRALDAWRSVAPAGRLVLLESKWGAAAGPGEAARARCRRALGRLRGRPPAHHAEYDDELRACLPLGRGTRVEQLLELVAASGWGAPRLHRLDDLEWAARTVLPLPERLLGTTPRFAVVAGS